MNMGELIKCFSNMICPAWESVECNRFFFFFVSILVTFLDNSHVNTNCQVIFLRIFFSYFGDFFKNKLILFQQQTQIQMMYNHHCHQTVYSPSQHLVKQFNKTQNALYQSHKPVQQNQPKNQLHHHQLPTLHHQKLNKS